MIFGGWLGLVSDELQAFTELNFQPSDRKTSVTAQFFRIFDSSILRRPPAASTITLTNPEGNT